MKTLYIECKMGAAGDMLQAALYELLDEKQKAKYLASMNQIFGDTVSVSAESGAQCGISGTHMHVTVLGQEEMPGEDGHVHEEHEHMHEGHEHEHDHMHEGHEHEHDHMHEGHEHEHDHMHEGNVHEHDHMHEGHEHPHDDMTHEQMHAMGIPHSHEELTHEQMHAMGIPHAHEELTHEQMHAMGIPHSHDELTHEQMHAMGIPHSHDAVAHICVEHEPEQDHDHMHEHDNMHEHDHMHDHDHEHEHEHMHDHEHMHEHHHHHAHYSYASVCEKIEHLPLPSGVKADASAIYRLIGQAEAKAHNSTLENIHFHEVGSLDAMADVVGCSLLISYLAPEQIIVSPIHVGNGTVKCAHGILPVPAPATAEILKGVPYYTGNINTELCTPTGAAVLKHFADSFGNMPVMTVEASGFGLGHKEFPVANGVRTFLGNTVEDTASLPSVVKETGSQLPAISMDLPGIYEKKLPDEFQGAHISDQVIEISCNIDDMTGEELGFAMDLLLDAGALDVYYESIYMKKNRPAVKLSCLCRPSDRDKFALLILKHTSTRGVRFQLYQRAKLESRYEEIETEYGTVRKKINYGYGVEKTKYEYEDLKKIALEKGLSIRDVMELLQ